MSVRDKMTVLDAAEAHRNRMKTRQKEFGSAISKALEHYRSQLGCNDLDERTKEIIIENLQFKAYGPPSLSVNPAYWFETYPGLPKHLSVVDEAQLLNDDYWIAAYNSVRAPHATNYDTRVLRKFIRETMSLIRKASATRDVIKVLKNNMARTVLFHLVFCISTIINSTSQRREHMVVFAEKRQEFFESAQGMADGSFSASSDIDPTVEEMSNTGKKLTRAGARAGAGSAPPHPSYRHLDITPWHLPELASLDTAHRHLDLTSWDLPELASLDTEILLILKAILSNVGAESSLVVTHGVQKLRNELKKEQDVWKEELAREESAVTNSSWRRRVSTWSNRAKMQDELSWREMFCSVYYLKNVPSGATFQKLDDLLDYDELWPVSSDYYALPAFKDPHALPALNDLHDTPKPPGSGFFRNLLKKLEKEGLM